MRSSGDSAERQTKSEERLRENSTGQCFLRVEAGDEAELGSRARYPAWAPCSIRDTVVDLG